MRSFSVVLPNKNFKSCWWVELTENVSRSVTQCKLLETFKGGGNKRKNANESRKRHWGRREKAWEKRGDWRCDRVRQTLFVPTEGVSVCMRVRREEVDMVIESNHERLTESGRKKGSEGGRCDDKFYTLGAYLWHQSEKKTHRQWLEWHWRGNPSVCVLSDTWTSLLQRLNMENEFVFEEKGNSGTL